MGKEQEEMDNRLAEEIRWAEEIKIQTQKEKEEKERKEKERLEGEKQRAEHEKKEKERQKRAKEEKEMLKKLEEQAKEKLRIQKEEEEKRLKEEKDAWEKMPRWKKEKILRERKGSLTSNSSRKNSLADSSEMNSPIGTPLRKDSLQNSQSDSLNNNQNVSKSNGINAEHTDNLTYLDNESRIPPVIKTETPVDIKNDKFTEWLEKELDQTKQDQIKEELKPPAPVRRRKALYGEESEETVVPVTRPTRRSRVGDSFNHEKSPSLSVDSPAPSNGPVASTRIRRSKAELPSPASTETADGVIGDEIGWVLENTENAE